MSLYSTNGDNQVVIGNLPATQLAKNYGTPLQVYDVDSIRQQIRAFKNEFTKRNISGTVSYASKALSIKAIYQIIEEENAHADVVSGGELATAIAAGFPAHNLSFHGNNKSRFELDYAIKNGIGMIIVDNFHELDLLDQVLKANNAHVNILIRVTPGISAHTHEYIQTGQADSKFGFDIHSDQADHALQIALANKRIDVLGIHAHIGSQIFDTQGFELEAQKLIHLLSNWEEKYDFTAQILNIGGGFGIKYTNGDDPLKPETILGDVLDHIQHEYDLLQKSVPSIWIEPGRAIVGPAGYSLYTIGSRKDVPGLQPYLAVDGGMGDNLRPALYQAEYAAVLAENPNASNYETVHLAGKYCESGDILIDQLKLPQTKPGDTIVILATGAYGYSMASNYNRNPRPAVVFVENDEAKMVVKRETFADLIQNDLDY
ncbi:diaminopimelate decarboxylase [Pediococcus stilesii]|uniref:Diaminopimelate decarboxylase n=1 Tax=Pediococcus stilesii TaxID=331679 RepID=A0A5R9BYF8_9LACO|nr:diaminopimelate decarboxylase [Pediococcus stilesii]TLQ05736.1 diaminopimelate decarboxylase [Pediococcus stilesii]